MCIWVLCVCVCVWNRRGKEANNWGPVIWLNFVIFFWDGLNAGYNNNWIDIKSEKPKNKAGNKKSKKKKKTSTAKILHSKKSLFVLHMYLVNICYDLKNFKYIFNPD